MGGVHGGLAAFFVSFLCFILMSGTVSCHSIVRGRWDSGAALVFLCERVAKLGFFYTVRAAVCYRVILAVGLSLIVINHGVSLLLLSVSCCRRWSCSGLMVNRGAVRGREK